MTSRAPSIAVLLGLGLGLSCSSTRSTDCDFCDEAELASADEAIEADPIARGDQLFAAHCAVCHGDRGTSDGPASPFLFPEARDFSTGKFRLVSTENGAPTRADLVRTLRRGVPGSAMPAWGWMTDSDLEALASYVRRLAAEEMAFAMIGDGLTEEEAIAEANARLNPGRVFPEVSEVPATSGVLDEGAGAYRTNCASCHGQDGAGLPEPKFDEDGSLNWARDFTAGYLKGGRSARALGWRVQAGIPGSAMPPTELEPAELEALVAYLRSEVSPDAEANLVHTKGTIVARRVEELAIEPDAQSWAESERTAVTLAPLHAPRSGTGITRAYVSAQHDGSDVAIRVSWPDESGDLRIYSDLASPDACALQFSVSRTPRLFGMGSRDHPTNIWHWKALRISEVAGGLDLFERAPHVFAESFRGRVKADAPIYRASRSLSEVSQTVESMRVRGVDRIRGERRTEREIGCNPRWSDGEWAVVFTRACVPETHAEVELLPGHALHVALAIWNGSAGDRAARKSISIWQTFRVDP